MHIIFEHIVLNKICYAWNEIVKLTGNMYIMAKMLNIAYETKLGKMVNNDAFCFLSEHSKQLCGNVNLVFTSPPFPLNRKKRYGNMNGEDYLEWISGLAPLLANLLSDDGSIVIEMGTAWNPGEPTHSTLPLEALLSFKKNANLCLCQEFIYHNPARLPGPVEWVNKQRIRVKDSFTRIWWMSRTSHPKANNNNVLTEYSPSMKRLLKRNSYNSGKRPSEHDIGEKSFCKNNGGAIPSNVIVASNTASNDAYLDYCKKHSKTPHPARMPYKVPEFFIEFLTDPGDLVFDPFAGSNTTGYIAEKLERQWLSVEINSDYAYDSLCRFDAK